MAARSNQYIFGEFSPDEFIQFFVTPRSYVELPPFNERVSSTSQSSGSYCTPPVPYIVDSVRLPVCGEDYQHIRFGVDEVMAPDCEVRDSMQKVSSTLNPQAPEFILGCQPSQKAAPHAPDGPHFNSVDCPDSEPPSSDGSRVGQDLEGAPGSLGQRERKKKKKRPPGYYNYLEGSGGGGGGSAGHGEAALDVGLVNGHALTVSGLRPADGAGEDASVAELCSPASATPVSATAGAERTCESPDESSLDFTSGAGSSSDSNNMASSSSSSSSHSSGVAEGGRTAEQPPVPPPAQSPQPPGSGRQSPGPASPLPPTTTAPCTVAPSAPADGDGGDSRVSNGLAEPDAASGADGQKDSSASEPERRPSGAVEAPPTAAEARSPLPPAAPTANPPKSWASLFHNSKPLPGGPPAYVEVRNVPAAVTVAPGTAQTLEGTSEVREGPVPVSEDPMAPRLADLIENVKLIHKPVSLQPRGLINKGNWCYVNATLQALIACPPMYHLMKSIPMLNDTQRPCTSTPMIDSFVRLVNEFSNMPVPPKAKQQGAGDKIMKDIRPGVPFEPAYIYKLLTVIKSGLSEKVNHVTALGRQEDAEEYLGCVLNGLQEEMLALKKLLCPEEEKVGTLNGPGSQPGTEEDMADKEEEDSEDEWEQVGPRNKTSITRQADFVRTPISDIFGGHIRSVVYQQSSKESATLQPFFTLQLDIQSEKIRTLQEALEALVARESVQGYTTKTKQEIEISRRVTLEELPPVLVLHLKRFVFEKTGGCQKLIKNIDYPIDLEISKDLLSPGVRSKIFKGQRTYRLFAVVYHHGNSATGGHYTTDVFHIGLNGWLRIDDQTVKVINQFQVVKQTAERTAYLLYYRRVDMV
ncbi:ubiquitin carboxyl-terminal hydrolase 10 isoform X1 [Anguilla rostrata]|uniref:ubiquitin carboxyl-terminal hydrolase 10 isoform X1 n=1 Tax=Anguilla rostrata TaxID=7938 RepID=UPI0030D47E23